MSTSDQAHFGEWSEKSATLSVKDTVLVSLRVLRGSWHVEQDESGIVGFVDDDLVELDGGVHPPDIGVVPERKRDAFNKLWNYPQSEQLWVCSVFRSRPDAEHVSEAFGCGAARVRGSVLRGLLFGPGHLNSSMMLGAAAAAARRPVSLSSVGVIVIIRSDARQPEHWVAVFHQLGLDWTHKHVLSRLTSTLFFLFFLMRFSFPNSLHLSLSLAPFLFVPVCLCFLWRCGSCGLQYSCTWGKDTPTDNTRSPNLLKENLRLHLL